MPVGRLHHRHCSPLQKARSCSRNTFPRQSASRKRNTVHTRVPQSCSIDHRRDTAAIKTRDKPLSLHFTLVGNELEVIRLNNVALKYDRGPEVLSDVNFHLRPGSFHFLHGESGAGKTSLFRLMFMSIHPTRGKIEMFNHDVTRVERAKAGAVAPPHRHRLPGFPPARPSDHLGKRGVAAAGRSARSRPTIARM